MPGDRKGIQGIVLVEDPRSERFVRHLLDRLGFDVRKVRFERAPSGRGAAECWVLARYPREVRYLRSRQPLRFLLAIRDGDAVGVARRKQQLDHALAEAGLAARAAGEHIATPVPAWAIENWLFDLLDRKGVNEDRRPSGNEGPTWKELFDREFAGAERSALRRAAEAWANGPPARPELPSLADGRAELTRIDP